MTKQLLEEIKKTLDRYAKEEGINTTDAYNIMRWAKQGYLKVNDEVFDLRR